MITGLSGDPNKLFTELDRLRKVERKQLNKAHSERIDAAIRAIPDYVEVMERMKGVKIPQELIDEIMRSERSAEVAYYFALNPDALEYAAELTGRDLIFEIGRVTGIIGGRRVRVPMGRNQVN